MAYLPTSQRTSVAQAQDQNQVPQATALPTSSAGGGTAPSPVYGSTPAAPAGSTAAQSSPTYPLVTDYLRANEGAGKTMAAGVSGQMSQEADSAKAKSDQSRSDYLTQNQGAIDQWNQAVQSAQNTNRAGYDAWAHAPIQYHQTGNGAWWTNAQDYVPTAIPTTPNIPGYYTPPDVSAEDNRLAAQIGALGTDAGRETVLRERYGGPNSYAPGAAALDAAMLGRQGINTAPYADILAALRAAPSGFDTTSVDTSDYGDTKHRDTIADIIRTL